MWLYKYFTICKVLESKRIIFYVTKLKIFYIVTIIHVLVDTSALAATLLAITECQGPWKTHQNHNCFSKVNKTNKKNNVIKGNVGNEFQVMEQNITG